MREKSRLFLLFFGLLAGAAQAQDSTFSLLPGERWLFKIAPLSLIDPEPSFTFGVEHFFSPRWSFQQELGYGKFAFWTNQDGERPVKSVIRIRSEFRKYLPKKTSGHARDYLALDLFYKRTEQLRTGDQSINSQFFWQLKDVVGFHLKMGMQSTRKGVLDGFVGLGLRFISVRTPGRPDRIDLNRFPVLVDANFSDSIRPSMVLGFRLGLSGQSLGRKNKRAKS
jgi:hypothetical protein